MKRGLIAVLLILLTVPSITLPQWHKMNGPPSACVTAIAPLGSRLVLGTIDHGVCVSSNGGATWIPANSGMANADILSLDATDSFMVAGSSYGIDLSSDDGGSWSPGTQVFSKLECMSVVAIHDTIWVGTYPYPPGSGGVWFSSDRGLSWAVRNPGIPDPQINVLFNDNGHLYSGTNSAGLFLSTDCGESWMERNAGMEGRHSVLALAGSGQPLYAGTSIRPSLRSSLVQ